MSGNIISGVLLYQFSDHIKHISGLAFSLMKPYFVTDITIHKHQFKNMQAMKREINSLYSKKTSANAIDGENTPSYTLTNGIYYLTSKFKFIDDVEKLTWQLPIVVYMTDDYVTIYSGDDEKYLKGFVDYVYAKYNTSQEEILHYHSDGKTWTNPMYRPITEIPANSLTQIMNDVLADVLTFSLSEDLYKTKGWAYRRGYMFCGLSGSGKSTMATIIAQKYNMSIYNLELNCNGLDDSNLKYMCSSVQPNSIILLDEFDKQYEAMQDNDKISVSKSGILSSIDGQPKLPHFTIVILTSNNLDPFDLQFRTQLFRNGRIDKTFNFTEKFE